MYGQHTRISLGLVKQMRRTLIYSAFLINKETFTFIFQSDIIRIKKQNYNYKILTEGTETKFIKVQKKEIVTFDNKPVENYGDHI